MNAERMMWIFGACFILFGLPLFVVSDGWLRDFFGAIALAGLGGFALAFSVDGVQKGEVKFQNSLIQRGRQKYLFWSTIGVVAFAGIVVLSAVIWLLFFKEAAIS
jgi:hypothetical protein